MKLYIWHTWPKSRSTETYTLHIQNQICCTFIHWQFHCNTNRTADRWTV